MKKLRLLVLITALAVLAGCSFSFSTANITDAAMTTGVVDGKPADTVSSFPQRVETVYVYGILNNAPDDTTVTFVWKYLTDPQRIDSISFNNEGQSGVYVFSVMEPGGMWPPGDYSVDIYIDEREEPDATVNFKLTP